MNNKISYQTPSQWRKANIHLLKKYRGEWIAFTKDGIISHDSDYTVMMANIEDRNLDFVIERIYENEYIDPPKFYPVRFRSLKQHEWQPKYEVIMKAVNSIKMEILVDSGADFGLIPYQLGIDLGFTKSVGEKISKAEGIGGTIDYLLRELNLSIDGHNFNAPVAWIQDENCLEALLGRDVVFDLFDIEFKQAEETIIFKFRDELF